MNYSYTTTQTNLTNIMLSKGSKKNITVVIYVSTNKRKYILGMHVR